MTLFSDPPIPYSYTHPSGNRTDVQSNPGGENKRLLHCKQYWYKLKLNKDINNRNTITLYHKLRFLMSFWKVPFAKCSITKLFDPPLVSWTLKGIPFEKWSLFLYSTSHHVTRHTYYRNTPIRHELKIHLKSVYPINLYPLFIAFRII